MEIIEKEKLFEAKFSQQQRKFKDYEDQIKDLNHQINEITKGKDAIQQLQYEITVLKKTHSKEIENLKTSIEKEVRSKMEIEKKHKEKIASFETQIGIVNQDIKVKIEKIDKLKRELKANKSVTDLFKADIERQKDEIKDLKTENKEFLEKYTKSKEEVERLEKRLENIPDIDFDAIKLKEKIAKLKENKIKELVSNIDNVMTSMESNMLCYLCMEVFNDAQTLNPCGHNF